MSTLEDALVHFYANEDLPSCAHTDALVLQLTGAPTAEHTAHVAGCAQCRELLETIRTTEAVWSAPVPSPTVLRFPKRVRVVLAVTAALAAAALLWWPQATTPPTTLQPMGAGWELAVGVARGDRQFRLEGGERLETGDKLGFFYSAPVNGYLSVFYADGRAPVVRVFPTDVERADPVSAGADQRLNAGAVLSPGESCEWVIGLFSELPLSPHRAEVIATQMVASRQGCVLGAAPKTVDARVIVVTR